MVLDHIESLIFLENEDYLFDAKMTLARISQGLFWLYKNVKIIEDQVRLNASIDNTEVSVVEGPLKGIPTDWLSCAFQWYAVSLYNYIRLVGWLSTRDKNFINEYINRVIPNVKNYRHKVAAHFALTAPKENDNKADLISSIMTNIVYAKGYLRAGALSEIFFDENGNKIEQKNKTSWSLTKTHTKLIPRYWPDGPMKAYPSIKISAQTTRKFYVNWED